MSMYFNNRYAHNFIMLPRNCGRIEFMKKCCKFDSMNISLSTKIEHEYEIRSKDFEFRKNTSIFSCVTMYENFGIVTPLKSTFRDNISLITSYFDDDKTALQELYNRIKGGCIL